MLSIWLLAAVVAVATTVAAEERVGIAQMFLEKHLEEALLLNLLILQSLAHIQ